MINDSKEFIVTEVIAGNQETRDSVITALGGLLTAGCVYGTYQTTNETLYMLDVLGSGNDSVIPSGTAVLQKLAVTPENAYNAVEGYFTRFVWKEEQMGGKAK